MSKGIGERVGRLYQFLYSYRERYETKWEAIIVVIELFLIAVGLATALFEIREHNLAAMLDPRFLMNRWHDLAEFIVFIALGLFAFSRLIVALRKAALGYDYRSVWRWAGPRETALDIVQFYEAVKACPWGMAPGVADKAEANLRLFAEKISAATARVLSERSYLRADEEWEERDKSSLGEWFEAFPAALWYMPSEAEARFGGLPDDPGGYVSVIVPITDASRRHVRRGLMPTDLAELDRDVVDAFRHPRPGGGPGHVRLLAYVQICVSETETPDPRKLFAVSIQHIAYLLHGTFGATGDFRRRWTFDIVCESANRRMNLLLAKLGFAPVPKSHGKVWNEARPGRSYAGFPLFEIKVAGGEPLHDGRRDDATSFVDLLEERVRSYAARVGTAEPMRSVRV